MSNILSGLDWNRQNDTSLLLSPFSGVRNVFWLLFTLTTHYTLQFVYLKYLVIDQENDVYGDAQDEGRDAEHLPGHVGAGGGATDEAQGDPRHHLPPGEHEAAGGGWEAALPAQRPRRYGCLHLSVPHVSSADWKACMSPVRRNVGTRTAILRDTTREHSWKLMVFQVSVMEYCLMLYCDSLSSYGCEPRRKILVSWRGALWLLQWKSNTAGRLPAEKCFSFNINIGRWCNCQHQNFSLMIEMIVRTRN